MSRKLVVCCDGTWNRPENRTNVWRTYDQMRRQLGIRDQTKLPDGAGRIAIGRAGADDVVLFYDQGVGTTLGDYLRGGALGAGLSRNVCDAYHFLSSHYEPGAEIYVFGFSRGAYTARSLCGFIGATHGLLKDVSRLDVARAYLHDYARSDTIAARILDPSGGDPQPRPNLADILARNMGWPTAADRALASLARHDTATIRFIGVYDTVGALGVPLPKLSALSEPIVHFHDCNLGWRIENAVQALAADERRGPFRPTIWRYPGDATTLCPGQTCLQVWFPGVHSDVGGGYGVGGIGDISFDFMMREAVRRGLPFDPVDPALALNTDWDPPPPQHESLNGFYRRMAHFFTDGEYDRPVGPTARRAKPDLPEQAAGDERLHRSLVDRIGQQVVVMHEPDDPPGQRTVTYQPTNLSWSAADTLAGRAELPVFEAA